MTRKALFPVMALVALLVATAPAGAKPDKARDGARGSISLEGLALSSEFGTPTGRPTLVQTTPLRIPVTEGAEFSYSSIECSSGPAPFNDKGLDFNRDFPGLEDPAPIRSVVEGTVTDTTTNDRGRIEGTITSFLCENGEETDQIVISFTSRFRPTSPREVRLRGGTIQTTGGLALNGRFTITEGTGRFEDISGQGSFRTLLTCLPSTLTRNAATSCADLGAFSEAVFQARGSFSDPTVPTA